MKPQKLECRHTVMSFELDSFGHVNNATFLNYLEKARCTYLTRQGLSFNDFARWHRYPVVARASVEYKHPVTADDKIIISGWIKKHTAASYTMQYEIIKEDDHKLVLTGETFHVFVDQDNKITKIPDDFLDKFIKTNIDA